MPHGIVDEEGFPEVGQVNIGESQDLAVLVDVLLGASICLLMKP